MDIKNIFGSAVVSMLLLIYVGLVIYGVRISLCALDTGCNDLDPSDFTEAMSNSLLIISGLISALVVAVMSTSPPGFVPAVLFCTQSSSEKNKDWSKILSIVYLIGWSIAGFAAFVAGYLFSEPDTFPPLYNLGQAWLGIAVGAGYAYFGIEPQ